MPVSKYIGGKRMGGGRGGELLTPSLLIHPKRGPFLAPF